MHHSIFDACCLVRVINFLTPEPQVPLHFALTNDLTNECEWEIGLEFISSMLCLNEKEKKQNVFGLIMQISVFDLPN